MNDREGENMRVYEQIKDVMCDELAQLIRHPLDPNKVHTIGEMIDVVKDIGEITEKEDPYGQSFRGNSYQGNMSKYGFYPMYGYSFERGQNAQRDSNGRYMDGGNSMNGGYYAGGSNTKEELQRLMDKATNETEREAIRVAIESMNN